MIEQVDKLPAPEKERRRRRWGIAGALAVTTMLIVAASAVAFFYYFQRNLGPAQPIPFSHRFHVQSKQISCMMCHPNAVRSARAGVPPLETCMLCHRKIIPSYPWIQVLTRHYEQNRPVQWVRVINRVPEFTFFNHERHLLKGIDCGKCHGDVAGMDRLFMPQEFNMGFCVQCHRDEKVTIDCLSCHR